MTVSLARRLVDARAVATIPGRRPERQMQLPLGPRDKPDAALGQRSLHQTARVAQRESVGLRMEHLI